MKPYLLAHLPYTEIAGYLKKSQSLIIPFGTLEAHGKHLPVSSDTMIAAHIASGLAQKMGFLMAPPLEYGVTNSMFRYPAASYIKPEIYKEFVSDILESFASHGFKRLFLINGHGGHNAILDELVQQFAKKAGQKAAAIHWWLTANEITRQFYGADSGHGAADETAIVEAADETLVYKDHYSEDTIFRSAKGVFVHPVPGSIIYGADDGAPPAFNRDQSLDYADKVIVYLEKICRTIVKGWDDLDNYESGK